MLIESIQQTHRGTSAPLMTRFAGFIKEIETIEGRRRIRRRRGRETGASRNTHTDTHGRADKALLAT